MTKSAAVKKPVRVGVFPDVATADTAIVRLLGSGFDKKEIVVVAPESIRHHFDDVEARDPGGAHSPAAAAAGGAVGAVLGGVLAAATVVAAGGAPLIIAGPLITAAGGGAVAGGFIGAMLSRGFERETAQFYDQALKEGKILVGVECDGDQPERLEIAERVLRESGAKPIALRKG